MTAEKKTAEEILTKHLGGLMPLKYGVKYNKTIDAMREFAAQQVAEVTTAFEERLREELIKYDKWMCSQKWGMGEILSPTMTVDEYLKTREK